MCKWSCALSFYPIASHHHCVFVFTTITAAKKLCTNKTSDEICASSEYVALCVWVCVCVRAEGCCEKTEDGTDNDPSAVQLPPASLTMPL